VNAAARTAGGRGTHPIRRDCLWIVRLALRRPFTFVVMAILVVILSGIAIARMPTDILPDIDNPVVSAIWQYRGLSADEMERRIVTLSERSLTTTVADIEHIESQTYNGMGIIKVFLHPGARVEAAVAQMTAISQTVTRQMPPGTTPPLIIRYNASSVPILQLGLGGAGLSEQALYDVGSNFLRTRLATVQGASVLQPAGGKPRQIMVDLDQDALFARGLSPADVSSALNLQNLILPAGAVKIGDREYNVRLNSSPEAVAELNRLPISTDGPVTTLVGDVAHVRDGAAVQTNVVRQDGRRGALVSILKSGAASTLDIVDRVKQVLPGILATLPTEPEVRLLLDQSIFVRASINAVLYESLIAAALTGLLILLFLGSWRSTLIVWVSIPLSMLSSIIVLQWTGQTMNIMTLGGLALAIGMLVDDATVAIENIHRHFAEGKPLVRGILDGSQQIALPAFVATLTICIVFVPVIFLGGTAKYLFQPLALSVVFAMLASYVLSRTLLPTMALKMLASEVGPEHAAVAKPAGGGAFTRIHRAFLAGFLRFRDGYGRSLSWALHHRAAVLILFAGFCVLSGGLGLIVGQDFFPGVDTGQLRLHVRGPSGTRLESTEQLFSQVEDRIRQIIPPDHLDTIVDNIGLPILPINLAYSDSTTLGSADGEIVLSLRRDRPRGVTWEYARRLRRELPEAFPIASFYFQAPDMVSQILNFGVPFPVDVQVVGQNRSASEAVARRLAGRIAGVPGAVDVHLHQLSDAPELRLDVDRTRASQMGLTQRDVASSVLVALSSSGQVAPNFWLNPANGVSYLVAVQTPEFRIDSIDALSAIPLAIEARRTPEQLGNLAGISRGEGSLVVGHHNIQPVIDVFANVQDRDLGGWVRRCGRSCGRSSRRCRGAPACRSEARWKP
jgi:multidrug efflux pump subunit AcrB